MSEDKDLYCTVVSIVPFAIKEVKPGLSPNIYEIAAATEDEPSILHIGTGSHNVYFDENRGSLNVKDPSAEIARSVVEDFTTSQLEYGDGVGPGLFWVIGKLSVEQVKKEYSAELTSAKIRQRRWFEKLIRLADRDWERYKQPNVVSDFQRLAANILKLDPSRHGWLEPSSIEVQASIQCKACFSSIHPKAIICPICKVVQDANKAKNLEFATA